MSSTNRSMVAIAAAALMALACWPLAAGPQPLSRLTAPLWTQGQTAVVYADRDDAERIEGLARSAGAAVRTAPPDYEPAARSRAIESHTLVTLSEQALNTTDLSGVSLVVVPEGSQAEAFAASLSGPRPAPPWLTLVMGFLMSLTGLQIGRNGERAVYALVLLVLVTATPAVGLVVSLEVAFAALALGCVAGWSPWSRGTATAVEDAEVWARLTAGSPPEDALPEPATVRVSLDG